MKNQRKEVDLFDVSRTKNKSIRADKITTTDINILLNRVRLTKKTEFKKKNNTPFIINILSEFSEYFFVNLTISDNFIKVIKNLIAQKNKTIINQR